MKTSSELKSPSKRKGERSRAVFLLLGLFALVGWSYVIFMSDLMTVQDIEASGLKSLDALDVKRAAFDAMDEAPGKWFFPQRHIWFIDRKKISETLKDRLFAENVIVDKKDINILRLIVEERSRKLVYHSHQQYLWVDLQGIVTNELSDAERKNIQARLLGQRLPHPDEPPVIHRDSDELITTGYRVTNDEVIKEWIHTTSDIVRHGILYREYEPPVTSTSTQAIFTSLDGYDVIVDLGVPLDDQLNTYSAFLKSPNPKTKVSQYVDIRVPGRLYIK